MRQTQIYKEVNDVGDAALFGYRSMSLPCNLASLKKESSKPSCSGAICEHMRATGKEPLKLVLVETPPCRNKYNVMASIAN